MDLATAMKIAAMIMNNKGSTGKKAAVIVLLIVAPVFLIMISFMQMMAAFEPEGALQSSQDITGEQTAVYRSLQEIMVPYYEDLREELAVWRNYLRIKYSYEVPQEEDGTETDNGEREPVISYPTVMRRLNHIPENVMIAYLLMNGGIETKTAQINEDMLKSFLNNISSIQESVQKTETGGSVYWAENRLLTINEIAGLYFGNERDREQFILLCETYGEYFEVSRSVVILEDGSEVVDETALASLSNVPLYLQYDAAWKDIPYGNGTIKKNGCCPTCLAMVFSYFRESSIYPNDIVAWSGDRYYVSGAGTAWSIFEPAAAYWGVNCTNIGKDQDKMQEALRSGKLIIASMGPGTFTKGGHFIVLTGITPSGKIKVNDPNDSSIKNHRAMEFEVSLILRECKNMWVFG